MFGLPADCAIRQAQVHTPRRAEHGTRRLCFRETLLDRSVASHFTRGQVAESHSMPQGHVLGDDAADADLDVVRMGTEWPARQRGPRHLAGPPEDLVPLLGTALERAQEDPRGDERSGR